MRWIAVAAGVLLVAGLVGSEEQAAEERRPLTYTPEQVLRAAGMEFRLPRARPKEDRPGQRSGGGGFGQIALFLIVAAALVAPVVIYIARQRRKQRRRRAEIEHDSVDEPLWQDPD